MSGPWLLIVGLLTPVVLAVLGYYLHIERQARMLKTQSGPIPGGLRFSAHGWSVEVQRSTQQLQVKTQQGEYTHQPLEGGDEELQQGPQTVMLPAPGLRIEITPNKVEEGEPSTAKPKGHCSVVFHASDESAFAMAEKQGGERYLLRLENVPAPVAANFHQFAGQIRIWVEKLDRNVAQQLHLRAQRAEAEAASQARAAAKAKKASEQSSQPELEPAEQIAVWRKAAGFSGTSEVGYTPEGKIDWFIDLDSRGRITMYANKAVIHTTLMGAKVNSLGAELEISVRDQYWSEAESELQVYRIFKGAHSDTRRAWKERIEILCDKLRSGEISLR